MTVWAENTELISLLERDCIFQILYYNYYIW